MGFSRRFWTIISGVCKTTTGCTACNVWRCKLHFVIAPSVAAGMTKWFHKIRNSCSHFVFSKLRGVEFNNPAPCSNSKPEIGHRDKSILILHKSSIYCTTGYMSFVLGRFQLNHQTHSETEEVDTAVTFATHSLSWWNLRRAIETSVAADREVNHSHIWSVCFSLDSRNRDSHVTFKGRSNVSHCPSSV